MILVGSRCYSQNPNGKDYPKSILQSTAKKMKLDGG
jgi:hypothetical protein